MKSLFIDCPTGLAGDMPMAAFLDLGVPEDVIHTSLVSLGVDNLYSLKVKEASSFGLRGKRVFVEGLEPNPPSRSWKDISSMISAAKWDEVFREKVLAVFKLLAEAEGKVHGKGLEEVHFHEVGAIDALVDIVGVCAAIEYINPLQIICSIPPVGFGTVNTFHGLLPVPVPAVLEIAKKQKIKLSIGEEQSKGELTTPTGLALMAVFANGFGLPGLIDIKDIGVGLGHRTLDRPNLLRIFEYDQLLGEQSLVGRPGLCWQPLVTQETWIDDASPEDVAILIEDLRRAGALEVISQPVQMKKSRQGISLVAVVPPDQAEALRSIWFLKGTTLGVRESSSGRWVLPRRKGVSPTSFGEICVKQVRRPDGSMTIKPEHDDLVRLSIDTGKTLQELRQVISISSEDFIPDEDWQC